MQWRTLDLFCGAAGGWSLGLHRAGFTTVAACEIDPWRRAVFSRNNPDVMLYDDVQTLTADRIFRDIGFLPEVICGSPPCQDASTANATGRGVDGERTGLFFDAVRLVREVRPRWVLFENVPGLRARGYDRVHDELEAAGYTVWPLVVGAVHAGAPHLRKRVWIVALAKSAQEQMGRERRTGEPQDLLAVTAPMHGASFAWGQSNRNRAEIVVDDGHPITTTTASAADADEARRAGGQLVTGLREEALPGDRRNFLEAWTGWNGGPPDLGRVDDGVPAALASRRGVGRACLAAYGDAVVPQIAEAIGRAVRRMSAMQMAPGG